MNNPYYRHKSGYSPQLRGGVTIQNNNIHDADNGVVTHGETPGQKKTRDAIKDVGSDVMDPSGLRNGKISRNKSYGHIYPRSAAAHPDFMQFEGLQR